MIAGLERFEGRASLKTWILRILVNTATTRGVREARTVPFASLAGEDDDDRPAVDPERFAGPFDPYPGHWSRPPADGRSRFTGFAWPLPDGRPGPWVHAQIDPCRSAIHACRPRDLPLWADRALYEIELDGPVLEDRSKVVASRARLVRRVREWDERLCEAYCRWRAARIGEQRDGVAAYAAERERLAAWLAERLGLA